MTRTPHDLHRLVALLDRAADRILRETGTTYRRWRLLLAVDDLGAAGSGPDSASGPTQREVAAKLGLTEASTSRLVASAAADGLVVVASGGGRRRLVALTGAGHELLRTGDDLLGDRFRGLADLAGVDEARLGHDVRTLVTTLETIGESR